MKSLDLNLLTVMSAIVITVGLLAFTICNRNIKQDELMSHNIETAMSKGIDPIAVKCAYGDARNEMCITYVMTRK